MRRDSVYVRCPILKNPIFRSAGYHAQGVTLPW